MVYLWRKVFFHNQLVNTRGHPHYIQLYPVTSSYTVSSEYVMIISPVKSPSIDHNWPKVFSSTTATPMAIIILIFQTRGRPAWFQPGANGGNKDQPWTSRLSQYANQHLNLYILNNSRFICSQFSNIIAFFLKSLFFAIQKWWITKKRQGKDDHPLNFGDIKCWYIEETHSQVSLALNL